MTPEEFANSLFPESNWTGDEWKARRLKIAKLIATRDAEMRKLGAERGIKRITNQYPEGSTFRGALEILQSVLDPAAVAEGE